MSWPPKRAIEHHTAGGLSEDDGMNVDVDGHADYNTASHAGRRLEEVAIAEKPTICPSCGAMVDPLTTGCKC